MTLRVPRSTPAVAAVLVCGMVTARIAFSTPGTGDYVTGGPVAGDNAGPGVDALVHFSLTGFASHQPAMGLTSIILRAPFAGLASVLGGGSMLTYRLGALACLLPVAAFAAWLVMRRQPETVGWLSGLLAAALLLLSPAVKDAVEAGHPEGVLCGVLASGAVIAAVRGHGGWAGAMLGLAIGTKPWAAIAVPPVLSALGGQRLRTAAVAGGVTFVVTVAAPLADPAAFARAVHGESLSHVVNAFSLWWPVSLPFHLASGGLAPARLLTLGMTRPTATVLALTVALALLALAWGRARRRGGGCDALALLALLGLVRCACDTTTLEYYFLAVLIPLVVWETVGLGRAPVVAGLATVAVALLPGDGLHAPPSVLNAASITLTLSLGFYLTRRTFGGPAVDRRSDGSASRCRPATPPWRWTPQSQTDVGGGR